MRRLAAATGDGSLGFAGSPGQLETSLNSGYTVGPCNSYLEGPTLISLSPLLARLGSAAVVVARRGENASALFSVRRRAILPTLAANVTPPSPTGAAISDVRSPRSRSFSHGDARFADARSPRNDARSPTGAARSGVYLVTHSWLATRGAHSSTQDGRRGSFPLCTHPSAILRRQTQVNSMMRIALSLRLAPLTTRHSQDAKRGSIPLCPPPTAILRRQTQSDFNARSPRDRSATDRRRAICRGSQSWTVPRCHAL